MSLSIAGTICFDTIETPSGRIDRTLGGSGVYASVAAAFLTHPRLLGAVGSDFTSTCREDLQNRGIDLGGVQTLPDVLTQFWHGRYHPGLSTREHLDVNLDIFDHMTLAVSAEDRSNSHVFLAHMPPRHQIYVLDQLVGSQFVVADTIDHWIHNNRSQVLEVLRRVSGVVVNEGEGELLTGERNAFRQARCLSRLGPKLVIIKKGEHGVVVLIDDVFVVLPAYPTEDVIDPTGAGDTFAGAMMAALACGYTRAMSVAWGIIVASFTVEGFGVSRLLGVSRQELDRRLACYRSMLTF